MSEKPSSLNNLLQQQLLAAYDLDQKAAKLHTTGTALEIPFTGTAVSTAYEQLRNAAEYEEEHLLLQRAIKRFYRRNLFISKRTGHDLGAELIVDLVQAGYLTGNSYSKATVEVIDQLIKDYAGVYGRIRKSQVKREVAEGWVLALLATETESILNPHHVQQAVLYTAYNHFLQTIPKERFAHLPAAEKNYEFCLYIAIHQAILKSDIDTVRLDMQKIYSQSLEDTAGLISLNRQIDQHFESRLTQELRRVVNRYGAPFRILRSLTDDRQDVASLLSSRQEFMDAYSQQIKREYQQVGQRLTRGITKSIIFIFLTKTIIGIAIEIPYDLWAHGKIIMLPLLVNLLFPPIYMASLKLSLNLPSASNKRSTHRYIENVLFGDRPSEIQVPKQRRTSLSTRVIYALLFILPVLATIFVLQQIGFNLVQMLIFFVFFSTASFLGFRLSTFVRDLELTTKQTSLLGSLHEFFYLPFIFTGQWLARRYNQVNIVAKFMDTVIELPLKTVLRLTRQWMRFLHEKHEELY